MRYVSIGETRKRAAKNARRRFLDIAVELQQLSHATRGMSLKFILFIEHAAVAAFGSRSRRRDATRFPHACNLIHFQRFTRGSNQFPLKFNRQNININKN